MTDSRTTASKTFLPARMTRISKGASIVVSLTAVAVLIGWIFDIPVLKSLHPSLVSMKVNTAVCFLLSGLALWLLQAQQTQPTIRNPQSAIVRRRVALACAVLVALIGALTLAEYLGGWDLDLDQLLMHEVPGAVGTQFPGRMPLIAAVNFLLAGIALLQMDSRREKAWFYFAPATVALTSLLALSGYATNMQMFHSGNSTNIAVQTALAFLVLGVGLLCARFAVGIPPPVGFERALALSFGAVLAFFVVITGVAYQNTERIIESGNWRTHTQDAETVIESIHSTMVDVETSMRGFVLTGQESYLELYHAARGRIPELLRVTRTLTADNPSQQQRLAEMEALIQTNLQWRAGVIQLAGEQGYEAARQAGTTGAGERGMDAIRRVMDVMKVEEAQLLTRREADWKESNSVSRMTLIVLTGVILMLLLAGYKILRINVAARLQAAEGLRQSHERFQLVARATNDLVWDWDLATSALSWGENIQTLFGYRREDMEPGIESRSRRIHPNDAERITKGIHAAIDGGDLNWSDEYRFRRADGGYADVLDRGYVIRAADGKPARMIGAMQDITRRKTAEVELRESENRFRQLANSLPQLVWTCQSDGQCDFLSRKWIEYTGRPEEPQLGFGWLDQLHPDDRAPTVAMWEAAVVSNADFRAEFRIRRQDGEYRWFDTRAVRLRDAAGRTVKWFGTNTDITEHKLAEAQLRTQSRIAFIFLTVPDEEMYSEVLKVILDVMQSPFGVFGYIDEAGAFVVPTMTRTVWDKCQVQNKRVVFPRESWGCSSWPRAILEKRTICFNEPSAVTPEGHIAITRHISHPMVHRGEVVGLFQVANKETDYTDEDTALLKTIGDVVAPVLDARLKRERHEASLLQSELEIRELNANLEQRVLARTADLQAANLELDAFAYSVSHDLRSPLRGIDGYSKILLEDYTDKLDQDGQFVLQQIRQSAREMGQLIDDLLGFSRMGRQKMNDDDVDMHALAAGVFQEAMAGCPERAVRLDLRPLPGAYGDKAMLREVLRNLIGNAIKFTRPRGQAALEVMGDMRDHETVYCVCDNGVGFDMQYKDKLFKVFQRLHSAEEFEGTGIGLALVQRIILRHGGRVWAEGEVNKGAAFWFSLPHNKGDNDQ